MASPSYPLRLQRGDPHTKFPDFLQDVVAHRSRRQLAGKSLTASRPAHLGLASLLAFDRPISLGSYPLRLQSDLDTSGGLPFSKIKIVLPRLPLGPCRLRDIVRRYPLFCSPSSN